MPVQQGRSTEQDQNPLLILYFVLQQLIYQQYILLTLTRRTALHIHSTLQLLFTSLIRDSCLEMPGKGWHAHHLDVTRDMVSNAKIRE